MTVRAMQAWEIGGRADRPRLSGVLAPVLTPFRPDLSPDPARFTRHCRWLLSQGCAGLAVFGTTSEANSLSVEEREALLDELLGAGIDPAKLMPGTGCCALTDTVRLLLANLRNGGAGCITATGNVNAAAIARLFREWRSPGAEQLQESLNALRGAVEKHPVIAALKAIVAHHSGEAAWRTLRPPLVELPGAQAEALLGDLRRLGFEMPGLTA